MMRRRQGLALCALTLVGFALRMVHLTRFELFVDEAATWWFARLTAAGHLAEQMSLEPTPPLYYALVGVLMKVFGESDLVMRLPSVIFGAAGIPAAFFFGKALLGARVGWIAALLLSIHPLHVFYSREARVYPLLLCLTVATLWALWRALELRTRRAWTLFCGLLILVCYSHFYGLFLAATAALLIILLGRDARSRWQGLIATGLALLVFAPYVAMTFPHLQESGAAWSIETFYSDLPEEKRFGRAIETQLIGADYHAYLRHLDRPPTPVTLRIASLLAQLILIGSALLVALRSDRLRELGFLLVAWLVPILLPWAITQLGRPIFHSGRHDVYAMGSFCVLLALGLKGLLFARRPESVRGRWLRVLVATGVVAALVSGAGFRLGWLHLVAASSQHRAAGEWVASRAASGDRVIAMGIRRLVTQHYARLAGSDVVFESFPISTDTHPGWSDVMALIDDQPSLHAEARHRIVELEEKVSPEATLFLLLRSYERTAEAVSATWLVDRHVVENLWSAGWQRVPELSSEADHIEAYRRPRTDE